MLHMVKIKRKNSHEHKGFHSETPTTHLLVSHGPGQLANEELWCRVLISKISSLCRLSLWVIAVTTVICGRSVLR